MQPLKLQQVNRNKDQYLVVLKLSMFKEKMVKYLSVYPYQDGIQLLHQDNIK
jgi:hypothetical protein